MASVTASGSPSLTSAAAFQTQLRSEPTLGESFISGTTATRLGSLSRLRVQAGKRDRRGGRRTVVVRADLERLVAAHDQPRLTVLLVLQQAYVAGPALLPLARLADKLEELGPHLEQLLLRLLVGLDLDLFRESNDGFEVHILRLGGLVVLRRSKTALARS